MKKCRVLAVFPLALLILLALLPMAFAEENSTPADTTPEIKDQNPETGEPIVDTTTETEIAAMYNGIGAKVRLLQLEKSILGTILRGEKVIEFIKENYAEEDTNGLEAIIAELKLLKEEVAAVQPKANDENTVKQFVDLKNDARSLVKQFRETAKEILKDTNKSELAKKFKEIDWSNYNKLQEQIVSLIREYNAQRLEEFFSKLEAKRSELIEKVRNGEMKMNEVTQEIRKMMAGIAPLQRKKGFLGLNEMNARQRVFQHASVLAAKEKFLERRIERLNGRLERVREKAMELRIDANRLRNWIQERISNPKARPFRPGVVRGTIRSGMR